MYDEYGKSLAREVGLPVFSAPIGLEPTTTLSARPRRRRWASKHEADAFIRLEKKTTLAAWQDIWRSTHSDFFANAPIAIVAPPTYKNGLEYYLGEELGLPIAYAAYRTGPESAPSEDVRQTLRDLSPSPMIVFGSINERMIVAQERLPSLFLQCSFPGAVVRRATGTPFVGYAGAVWLLQCVCEALFDVLFANLPTSAAPPEKASVPTRDLMRDAPAARRRIGQGPEQRRRRGPTRPRHSRNSRSSACRSSCASRSTRSCAPKPRSSRASAARPSTKRSCAK